MTMRKRGMLVWALIALGLPSWCADFWDGNAAILKGDARFESGIYAASNSFPTDTEIQVQNLENQKIVTAVVTQRITGQPDILVFLSPKAGESLGMTQGRMNRVRVKVPLKNPIPTAGLAEDRAVNPDPDVNPSAGMAKPAVASAPPTSRPAASETPERPSADAPPAAVAAQKTASGLPAPPSAAAPIVASDPVPDVASRPAVAQAKETAPATPAAAPAAPVESVEETSIQKSAVKGAGSPPAAAATPEAPAAAALPAAAAATETVPAPTRVESAKPEALDEVLGRVPQKRLFLPPREDETFAYRRPVQPPVNPEPKAVQAPVKEPVSAPVQDEVKRTDIPPVKEAVSTPAAVQKTDTPPAKEPEKAASREPAVAQASQAPVLSGVPAPSAAGTRPPASKIAEIPVAPSNSYEVGDGGKVLPGAAEPQRPGHEPVAVARAVQTPQEAPPKDTEASDVSDAAPENPVWTPYVADLEPSQPVPPVEKKTAPDTAVVENTPESGPEAPGITSSGEPAVSYSGMPTRVSVTPLVASEARVEEAPEIRTAVTGRSGTVAAKPTDRPIEPAVDTAVKATPATPTAAKPETSVPAKPETAAAAKPADIVVTMEKTAEKPPAGTQKPVEKPVEKPAVAAKPASSLPQKPGALKPGEFYLQLAAYATESIAQETIRSLAPIYPVGVLPSAEKGKPLYRVVVGPLNKAESGTLLNWFKFRGFPDAFLKTGE